MGVRCDSIYPGYRYRAGCANPSFTPTYVLSSSRYPDIAKFDKAEIAKHPSWATLTRVSPAQQKKNRAVACKGFRRRTRRTVVTSSRMPAPLRVAPVRRRST